MAGFVVAPNTIKVLVHSTIEGRPQLNVLHAEVAAQGPLNPNIAETIWASARASLVTFVWDALISTQYSITGVGVIDLRGPNNPEISSTSPALAGADVANPLPAQDSIVVTLRTALTGRSHRGRIYTFGYGVDAVGPAGEITTLASNTAIAFAQSFQTGISAGGATLAVMSPALPDRPSKPGGTLPAKPFEITPVTAIVVRDNIWDTNRRRVDLLRR